MPEPDTRTQFTREPAPAASLGGNTAEWKPPLDPTALDVPTTHTREIGSTPGDANPELRTRTEDTEQVLVPPGSLKDVPSVPGYRVEKVIGRGGMATVYRAVHLEMDRVVALKVINPGGRDEIYVRERFEREVRTLASIEHPNVVAVYDCGVCHGFPFLTMKYVPEGSLSHHLARFPGKPEAIARLVAKIARGVQALHEAGIIHRDLKPLNILLAAEDEPLVADFGLAKWIDEPNSELTLTHIPLGTKQYMSPEQTLGQRSRYGAPCDIWAIGIILHELLAGSRPFSKSETEELYESIRSDDPAPLPPETPELLAVVVRKCLAKNPDDRYQTAAGVAEHLEDWLAGRPVTLPPPPPPPPVRPSPPWLIATGVCSLLGLIFLPPALIPFGKAREVTPLVQNLPLQTAVQVLNREGEVLLIDDKGKPLFPTRALPGRDVFQIVRDEYTRFDRAIAVGMLEFMDENLDLPIRLEVELAFSHVTADNLSTAFAGIYVVRRNWPNGLQSCVRFVVRPIFSPVPGQLPMLQGIAETYLMEGKELGAPRPLGEVRMPWNAEKPDSKECGFRRLVVEIHQTHLTGEFDGKKLRLPMSQPQSPPTNFTGYEIALRLRDHDRVHLKDVQFNPPVFGNGIGITVGQGEGTFRNLKLSKIGP